ncbi:unnamed protein product [[Candida] boidinii]|nr:unnamed protein product [[Candida] boidinii]
MLNVSNVSSIPPQNKDLLGDSSNNNNPTVSLNDGQLQLGQNNSAEIMSASDSNFFNELSSNGNDIFDFDSLLASGDGQGSNSGGLALNDDFSWPESVETGDL